MKKKVDAIILDVVLAMVSLAAILSILFGQKSTLGTIEGTLFAAFSLIFILLFSVVFYHSIKEIRHIIKQIETEEEQQEEKE